MGGMMNAPGQEEYEEEEPPHMDNKALEKAGEDKSQHLQSQGTPTQTAELLEVGLNFSFIPNCYDNNFFLANLY
jgi:hypothetical protein